MSSCWLLRFRPLLAVAGWLAPYFPACLAASTMHVARPFQHSIVAFCIAVSFRGLRIVDLTVTESAPVVSRVLAPPCSQDALGVQGRLVEERPPDASLLQVWAGPLTGGRVAVVFWNRGNSTAEILGRFVNFQLVRKRIFCRHLILIMIVPVWPYYQDRFGTHRLREIF